MPSSTNELREKFGFGNGNDGIAEAEKIILNHATIDEGLIYISPENRHNLIFGTDEYNDFWDAVQFLCEEWDYAFQEV